MPDASAASTFGCPLGDVCVYPQNAGWNNNHPSLKFYTYGYHNLSGQTGVHRVYNNQTGGAVTYGCTQSGGNGNVYFALYRAPVWHDENLGPVYSIVLATNYPPNEPPPGSSAPWPC